MFACVVASLVRVVNKSTCQMTFEQRSQRSKETNYRYLRKILYVEEKASAKALRQAYVRSDGRTRG
jgi:hypothetical protein